MASETISAATIRHTMMPLVADGPRAKESPAAHAVPTRTGTIAAGSVRGRAPASQSLNPVGGAAAGASAIAPAFVTFLPARKPKTWGCARAPQRCRYAPTLHGMRAV